LAAERRSKLVPGRAAAGGLARLTFFEQPPPSTLVDIATLTEARLVREAYTSRRAMKPVSLDEAGSKIDNQIQIGHNMTVGGYC
jgi:hypothetical protein